MKGGEGRPLPPLNHVMGFFLEFGMMNLIRFYGWPSAGRMEWDSSGQESG